MVLNVGGCKFTTTLSTLRNAPESLFNAMFSGRHELKPDDQGCYFIDRWDAVTLFALCVCVAFTLHPFLFSLTAHLVPNQCYSRPARCQPC